MPRRTPADVELVRRTYERTGSGRETARQLGLHENTVYAALKRLRGKCVRCGREIEGPTKHCPSCLEKVSERMRQRRAEQKRLGLCVVCNERVEWPSRTLCAQHRVTGAEYSRRRDEKRRGTYQGEPSHAQRRRRIRQSYGQGGLEAWERDGAACRICGSDHGKVTVQLHHLDLGTTDNSSANLVCLCFDCHQLVHRLIRNRNARAVLDFVAAHYPSVL